MLNKLTLKEAIQQQTQFPWDGKKVKYYKLPGPDQSTIDRKMNERKIKLPRNIKLLEDEEPCSVNGPPKEYTLNEREIALSIQRANGGINYSNEFYERYWKMKQMQLSDNASSSSNHKKNAKHDNNTIQIYSSNDNSENKVNSISTDEMIKKCGLSKNAAIQGLLKNNKISVKDLQAPPQHKTKFEITNTSTGEQCSTELKGYLVEHPEVSDVFIHPLQAFRKFDKSIDCTMPHVGKKKVVTPRRYYVDEMDDDSFTFVKIDKKTK